MKPIYWVLIGLFVLIVGYFGYKQYSKYTGEDPDKPVKPPLPDITPPKVQQTGGPAGIEPKGSETAQTEVKPVSLSSREAQTALNSMINYISNDSQWVGNLRNQTGLTSKASGLSLMRNYGAYTTLSDWLFSESYGTGVTPQIKEGWEQHLFKRAIDADGLYPSTSSSNTGVNVLSDDFIFRNVPEFFSFGKSENFKNPLLVRFRSQWAPVNSKEWNGISEKSKSELAIERSKLDSAVRQAAIDSLKLQGWKFLDA
jgi:hypothetical protein